MINDSLVAFFVIWAIVLLLAGKIAKHLNLGAETFGTAVWYGTIFAFAGFCLYELLKKGKDNT